VGNEEQLDGLEVGTNLEEEENCIEDGVGSPGGVEETHEDGHAVEGRLAKLSLVQPLELAGRDIALPPLSVFGENGEMVENAVDNELFEGLLGDELSPAHERLALGDRALLRDHGGAAKGGGGGDGGGRGGVGGGG